MKLIGLLVLLALVSLVEGEVVDQAQVTGGNPFGQNCAKYFPPPHTAPPAPGYLNPNTYKWICQRYESAVDAKTRVGIQQQAQRRIQAAAASLRQSRRNAILAGAAMLQKQAAELPPARYATLYDTQRRIPVYSAYLITGPNEKKNYHRHAWMTEPQLDGQGNGAMSSEVIGQGGHQAIDKDYDITNFAVEPHCYERGHLYPISHTRDKLQADSTFTLTNTAPQWSQDNKMWYHEAESQVIDNILEMCKIDQNNHAYVVTGVIPSQNQLNGRVNIPSEYWTAFCCQDKNDNKLISLGYRKEMNKQGNGMLHTYPVTGGINTMNTDLQIAYQNNNFELFGSLPGCS